eukprot:jgi/Galph1/2133/GphlegSOOS_G803.1
MHFYQFGNDSFTHSFSPTWAVIVLMTFALILRWINLKTAKLPPSVMVSFAAILSAHLAVFLHECFPNVGLQPAIETIVNIQKRFPEFVLRWAIGFLLFGDSLEVDVRNLRKIKDLVAITAIISTLLSSAFIGYLSYITMSSRFNISLSTCLLMGAIISPTDPVTVMSVLKNRAGSVPEFHRILVMGESLFNDVVGVVLTEGMKSILVENNVDIWNIQSLGRLCWTFFRQCVLGILVGFVLGYLVYHLLACQVEDSILEVGITVAMVGNINLLCHMLGASLPLASVTAGLLLGNYGFVFTISLKTHEGMKWVWSFCTEMLNTLLFILIGFQSLFFSFITSKKHALHFLVIIPISLLSRALSVAIPFVFLKCFSKTIPSSLNMVSLLKTIFVLTWCGLRGAISIALAMTVPEFIEGSSHVYTITYILVVFSILVQGLLCDKIMRIVCYGLHQNPLFSTIFEQVHLLKPLPSTKEVFSSLSPSPRRNNSPSFMSPLTPLKRTSPIFELLRDGKGTSPETHFKNSDTADTKHIDIESVSPPNDLITAVGTQYEQKEESPKMFLLRKELSFSPQRLSILTKTTKDTDSFPESDEEPLSKNESESTLQEYTLLTNKQTVKKLLHGTVEASPLLPSPSTLSSRGTKNYLATESLPPSFPR